MNEFCLQDGKMNYQGFPGNKRLNKRDGNSNEGINVREKVHAEVSTLHLPKRIVELGDLLDWGEHTWTSIILGQVQLWRFDGDSE